MDGDFDEARDVDHETDRLIRQILVTGRSPNEAELATILRHVRVAPFNPDLIVVPPGERGRTIGLTSLGRRVSSLTYHRIKHVWDGQWSADGSDGDYLADLRRAVDDPRARIGVFWLGRRPTLVVLSMTPAVVPEERLGRASAPYLHVVYHAGRGTILTGYQVTDVTATTLPRDIQWLR